MDKKGFFRVAACSPMVSVADPESNTDHIISIATELTKKGVRLAVFPEMSVTGYTCADLFHNRTLIDASYNAISKLCKAQLKNSLPVMIVGAPILLDCAMYNCALVIANGHVCAVIPKTYLPNYNEFYERRWWQPAPDEPKQLVVCGDEVTMSTNQLICIEGVKVGVEICEDLWTPIPPSCRAAMAGAQVIANLSASDDLIGKYNYLNSLISQQSARCMCGYVYASAGYGESSTDLVFDGKTIISENGTLLARNKRWQTGDQYVIADIDIMMLDRDRMHHGSYTDCVRQNGCDGYVTVNAVTDVPEPNYDEQLYRIIDPTPFVPRDDDRMNERCDEIINIQVAGLAKRLDFIKCKTLVVGISGGLDSTLALLVAVKAFDRLGLDRKGILGITMPGFGTTNRTKNNAVDLMTQLGISQREVNIVPAVMQHFKDIQHDPEIHDVTYENCQARERTQILMDTANKLGGIVLGTGDLSELALGWATYNGDHMSMYGVNAGVPKTLVKYLIRHIAKTTDDETCSKTLFDIIDTPISPELIPADKDGNITQKTEDIVGPYELHDFFLYYTLRYGFTPERIYFLSRHAFADRYADDVIRHWLQVFNKRFFQQQFKRSCMPDGPKVGSVCLSPRGDWRMPSDASSAEFQLESEK